MATHNTLEEMVMTDKIVCDLCDEEIDPTISDFTVRHYKDQSDGVAQETWCELCESMEIDDAFGFIDSRMEHWRNQPDNFKDDVAIADWLLGHAEGIKEYATNLLKEQKLTNIAALLGEEE